MELSDIPKPVLIGGAAVVVGALVLAKRNNGGASITTLAPSPGKAPDTAATLGAASRSFNTLAQVVRDELQMTTNLQTTALQTGAATRIAEINQQGETTRAQAQTDAQVKVAQSQAGASVTNTKTAAKTSVWNTAINGVTSIVKGILHFL